MLIVLLKWLELFLKMKEIVSSCLTNYNNQQFIKKFKINIIKLLYE